MEDRRGLMADYDVENQVELGDLVEESDEGSTGGKRTSFDGEGRLQNGYARVEKEKVRPTPKGQ
jgi:hypothetical protein